MNKKNALQLLLSMTFLFFNPINCTADLSPSTREQVELTSKKNTSLRERVQCLAKSAGLASLLGISWYASYILIFRAAYSEFMEDYEADARSRGKSADIIEDAAYQNKIRWAYIAGYLTLAFGSFYAPIRLKFLQKALANLQKCH